MMRVAVIGLGKVGFCVAGLFRPEQVIEHDPPRAKFGDLAAARFAFVCVPTPTSADGSCDTSIVEQAISEIPPTIQTTIIKSTVPPGFTEHMRVKYNRRLIFSPEYVGEGGYYVPPQFPDPHSMLGHGFVILGGHAHDCGQVADLLLPVMGPTTRFRFMTSTEAELVKYFENAYLALKVTFANEMRAVCEGFDVSYHVVREGWLDDPRIGASHSAAFASRRGFDGKCLPKDLAALRAAARYEGIETPLLDAVAIANAARVKS